MIFGGGVITDVTIIAGTNCQAKPTAQPATATRATLGWEQVQ
jgi:hypothetical protein